MLACFLPNSNKLEENIDLSHIYLVVVPVSSLFSKEFHKLLLSVFVDFVELQKIDKKNSSENLPKKCRGEVARRIRG